MGEEEKHKLTLRLPVPLHQSMLVRKGITGQSVTSQLIETAMRSEREFQQILSQQRKSHTTVMNTLYT